MQAQLLPCIISLADSDVIKRGLMEKESKLENNSSNNRSKKDNTNWSPVLGPSATLGPAVMNIQLPVLIDPLQLRPNPENLLSKVRVLILLI